MVLIAFENRAYHSLIDNLFGKVCEIEYTSQMGSCDNVSNTRMGNCESLSMLCKKIISKILFSHV